MRYYLLILATIISFTASKAQVVEKTDYLGLERTIIVKYSVNEATGKLHGQYSYQYNEQVYQKGEYAEGLRTGLWNFKSFDGTPAIEGSYVGGKKEGLWKYYRDGALYCELEYKADKKDGQYKQFDQAGSIVVEMSFINDLLNGKKTEYFADGKVKSESLYKNGKPEGSAKFFYQNGTLREESTFTNGNYNGISKVFFSDGSLHMIAEFNQGKLISVKEQHTPNRKVTGLTEIAEGKGKLTAFYIDNEKPQTDGISNVSEFVNGVRNGKYVSYYRNHQIKRKGKFSNGYENGTWKYYDEQGEITGKVKFRAPSKSYGSVLSFYNEEKENTVLGSHTDNIDTKPCFQGGEEDISAFISMEINYPEKYSIMGVGGQVIISLVIDETGNIYDAKVVKGVNEDLDAEALRVINLMPRWTPGFMDGVPVKTGLQIPISFTTNY